MSIRRKSTIIFITSLVQFVFGMGAGIITAHLLGPQGKGIALLTFVLPGFLSSLGSFSVGDASVYFASRGVPPRRVVSNTILQAFGLGIVYSLICMLLMEWIRQKFFKDVPRGYMVLGLITLPMQLVKSYGDGLLVALDRIPWYVAGNLILHSTRAILILVLLMFFHLGTIGAVSAEFTSWILTGICYIAALTIGIGFTWKMDWKLAKDQLRYSGQTHIGNMAMRGNHQVSTFFLSSLRGAAAVGLFSVGMSIAQILWYLPFAVGRILFPRVAGASREEANAITAQVCRNAIFITAIGCIAVIVTGPFVIPFVYGKQFGPSVGPLLLLLPGILALTLNIVLSRYLSGIGKPYLNSIASVVSFLFNLPLLMLLVTKHGLEGAAIATSITYMVSGVLSLYFFVRESKTPFLDSVVPTGDDFRLYLDSAVAVFRRVKRGASAGFRRLTGGRSRRPDLSAFETAPIQEGAPVYPETTRAPGAKAVPGVQRKGGGQ